MRSLILVLLICIPFIAFSQSTSNDSTKQVNYLKRSGNLFIGGSVAMIAGSIGLADAYFVSDVKIRKVMFVSSFGLYGVAGVLFLMAGNDLIKSSDQRNKLSFNFNQNGIGLALKF